MLASCLTWHLRRVWAPPTFIDKVPPPQDSPAEPLTLK
jgi:hypothetical protein